MLTTYLVFRGQSTKRLSLQRSQRKRLEKRYEHYLTQVSANAPDALPRFHLGNQIANAASLWLMALGLIVPVTYEGFTFGPFWAAPVVLILDALLLWVGARIVMSRIAIRLWEGSLALERQNAVERTFGAFWAPVAGGVFGALGGVVLGQIMAVASAMETIWLFPQAAMLSTLQSTVLSFAFMGIMPAAIGGAVVGAVLVLSLSRAENG